MAAPLLAFSGNFGIHGYGLAIASGLMIALWSASQHPWCRLLGTADAFINLITTSVFVGIIGGRALYSFTEWGTFDHWTDIFFPWEGGFSVWGTVIALLIFLPAYTYYHRFPVFLTLDLCGLYALLVHAISRLGCWHAGCCGGLPSTYPWALPNSEGILAHPTQLYSALLLLICFIIVKTVLSRRENPPGRIIAWYIMCISFERLIVDFWREDRIMTLWSPTYSVHQIIAVTMLLIGIALFILSSWLNHKPYEHI